MSQSAKAKLKTVNERAKKSKAKVEKAPHVKRPRPMAKTTSYLLPNKLLDDLEATKRSLQIETGDQIGFTCAAIARTALRNFVQMEMDEQIELMTLYKKEEPAISSALAVDE